MAQSMSVQTNGEKIGQYVHYQRSKRKLSLNQFAKNIKVDPSFLQRLEVGKYQGVGLNVLEKIAKGFDMSLEDLLRKSRITSYQHQLPKIEFYLREMYQFPDGAINECRSFISFLQNQYKKEIGLLKKQHDGYWKK